MLEHRIATLEEAPQGGPPLSTRKSSRRAIVGVGSTVKLKDIDAKETIEYVMVGSAEADPENKKLSNESPVGQAIMGRKKGETVDVATPRGKLKFKIVDVQGRLRGDVIALRGAFLIATRSMRSCAKRSRSKRGRSRASAGGSRVGFWRAEGTGSSSSSISSTAPGAFSCSARQTAPGQIDVDLGDIVGVEGFPARTRPGRAVADRRGVRDPGQDRPAVARYVPRPHRRRDEVSEALSGPRDER